MFSRKTAAAIALSCAFTLSMVASGAKAQTTAAGPYYATPSWDQTLPASTRFIVLTNFNSEAVLDRETGLVWEKTPSASLFVGDNPPDSFGGWAAEYCIGLNVGGRHGWRLPTIQELESLVDDTQMPALPLGHPFIGISGSYWTSTLVNSGLAAGDHIFFDFATPGGIGAGSPESAPEKVWCVRGGPAAERQ